MRALRDFRLSQGLTQAEMAAKIGVSQSLYEKIEYGDRSTSRAFLAKLKAAYPSVDLNIFFTRQPH